MTKKLKCPVCAEKFAPTKDWQKFCSARCRVIAFRKTKTRPRTYTFS